MSKRLKIPKGKATVGDLSRLWQELLTELLRRFETPQDMSAQELGVARMFLLNNGACFDQVHKVPTRKGLQELDEMDLPFRTH